MLIVSPTLQDKVLSRSITGGLSPAVTVNTNGSDFAILRPSLTTRMTAYSPSWAPDARAIGLVPSPRIVGKFLPGTCIHTYSNFAFGAPWLLDPSSVTSCPTGTAVLFAVSTATSSSCTATGAPVQIGR